MLGRYLVSENLDLTGFLFCSLGVVTTGVVSCVLSIGYLIKLGRVTLGLGIVSKIVSVWIGSTGLCYGFAMALIVGAGQGEFHNGKG
jgi:hypothetical protein